MWEFEDTEEEKPMFRVITQSVCGILCFLPFVTVI